MKQQQKLLLLAVWLIALPLQLWAQDNKPFFNLKKGDWFVYQVDMNSVDAPPPLFPQQTDAAEFVAQFRHQFHLKFTFTNQLANGTQQFDVTLERVNYKMLLPPQGVWLGHDSYYPPYTQALPKKAETVAFKMEVSPQGQVTALLPQALDHLILLEEISPKKSLGSQIAMSVNPLPLEFLQPITDFITMPSEPNKSKTIGIQNDILHFRVVSVKESARNRLVQAKIGSHTRIIPFSKENGLPVLVDYPGLSIVLADASFPVPANTIVKGRLLNAEAGQKNEVTINNRNFPVKEDGTFTGLLTITNPSEGFFKYSGPGATSFPIFLVPGDTLVVTAGAANFQKSLQLAGTAAQNSRLAMAAQQAFEKQNPGYAMVGNSVKTKEADVFVRLQEQGRKEFQQILNEYEGKASATAIGYYKMEWTFLQAKSKLYFLYTNRYRSSPAATVAFHGFPHDFFLDIDTLPVLMNDFVGGMHYFGYFTWYLPYQQARVGMSVGGQRGFLADYSIALASLKQYPLYKQLLRTLEEEINGNTWTQNQRIKPYYEDFVANCNDPFYIETIKNYWERSEQWVPGKVTPVKSLLLENGEILDLTKFKGKAVCLIINNHDSKELLPYLEMIKNYNQDEVHFVIAQMKRSNFKVETIPNEVLKSPNVTFVEMGSDIKEMERLGVDMFTTSVFILDKWLRVVENNIRLHQGAEQLIDAPLQKAIDAKRFSEEQKSELIKTAGWSLGSILFAVIIGLFLYRNRLKTIRQQELVKRQMQELEIKAIRSQMNPHFVFNALNSIQSLINGNQFREANIYLAKFATLLRSVLNNSEKNMVPLSDELDAVKLYCQLEQLRFDFAFELVVDEAINPNLIEIPPMIIQPLVENAIVHGLAPKGNEGELQIHISLVQGQLQVLVTDNGAGLHTGKADKLSQKGFGLKLVQERINILSHEDKKASLSLQSAPAGEAKKTTSLLTIPID